MKLKITVDGKVYEVDVEVSEPEPPQPGYVPPPGQARVAAAAPSTLPPSRRSGDVPPKRPTRARSVAVRSRARCRKISAQVGQTIQVNDILMVLEAMKMETVITAPISGKVAKINVNVGDAVQHGQVLVEFE